MNNKITELLKPIIESEGYILDAINYSNDTLEVIIDSNKGISVEDCVKVTKLINPILDDVDPIKTSYVLDVCSKEKGSVEDGK